MSYYDNKDFEKRGMDYDLLACLDNNPQSFFASQIEKVLAVYEGQNDGEDWRWVLHMKDGTYTFLRGWCDYTGWDCRSTALSVTGLKTPEEAAKKEMEEEYGEEDVHNHLEIQIRIGKNKTWREKTDETMPDVPFIE